MGDKLKIQLTNSLLMDEKILYYVLNNSKINMIFFLE